MATNRSKHPPRRYLPRLIRAIGSFAVVLAAYGAYAMVAVPLIEPPPSKRPTSRVDMPSTFPSGKQDERFASLFPPNSWVLAETPKVLESDQGKLLFQKYKNLDNPTADRHQVQLSPMAIVFTPEAEGATDAGAAAASENGTETPDTQDPDAENRQQAIVLEAPEGAVLDFDEPLRLSRMQFGRLIGGRLVGPVTIRSEGKLPGPEDDLRITTTGVQLTEEYIKTSSAVEFRFGPHYGRGHGMTIKLAPDAEPRRKGSKGPNIGGVESFEMQHIERLCLEMSEAELASDQGPLASVRPGDKMAGTKPSRLPVEVTCRGPFRFDMDGKVATFSDRVDVRLIHPNGPCDQINCEQLSIFFVTQNATAEPADGANRPDDSPSPDPFDLQPQRIVARGNPVIVAAPSEEVYARGQLLEYDLLAEAITLDAADEVVLKQALSEIHARKLDYRSNGPGRLGDVM
ncbi:MAG TPA: hypothetical protein VE890_15060, partial [Thermoguttaceae bacterium]|nr:hypothetical protein [Thermoguttaceae bacterium]